MLAFVSPGRRVGRSHRGMIPRTVDDRTDRKASIGQQMRCARSDNDLARSIRCRYPFGNTAIAARIGIGVIGVMPSMLASIPARAALALRISAAASY